MGISALQSLEKYYELDLNGDEAEEYFELLCLLADVGVFYNIQEILKRVDENRVSEKQYFRLGKRFS